jgi:sensor histidine kinase YesM
VTRYFKFSRQDVIVLLVSVYPFMMVACYLMLGSTYFQFPFFVYVTLTAFAVGTISWVSHIVAANYLRAVIPSYTKIVKRILIQLPVYMVLTQAGLCLLNFNVFRLFGFIDYPLNWENYRALFFAGLLLNVIATSFHEGLFAFEQWKTSLVETERLKKSYVQSQLDSLKNQVNPHFLFNSLNCLSSLIDTEPAQASLFVDELSKVYRYLLRANENELIPLRAELQFINSYFHLLKTRYGQGIELSFDIEQPHEELLIPPLTLQMLIENAVKHNIILRDQPLKINIETSGDLLTVSNNIQLKTSGILSNKVGLQNIATKYELLHQGAIGVEQGNDVFTVSLPLIKSLNYESTDHRR